MSEIPAELVVAMADAMEQWLCREDPDVARLLLRSSLEEMAETVMDLFDEWTLYEEYRFGTERRTVWVGPWAPVVEPTNDIDATGQCCCAGCIGMGPCDLDPIGDAEDEDQAAESQLGIDIEEESRD